MPNEEHVATLVHPDEFAKNANQVASVSTQKLVFIKRKELALKPFELLEYPLENCTAITYETKWAVFPMAFGALLAALVVFILGSEMPSGTRVPIGALAVAFAFGVVLLRGPKRHLITFHLGDRKLRWRSKAGDFKYKVASTQKIIAFAREKNLLR